LVLVSLCKSRVAAVNADGNLRHAVIPPAPSNLLMTLKFGRIHVNTKETNHVLSCMMKYEFMFSAEPTTTNSNYTTTTPSAGIYDLYNFQKSEKEKNIFRSIKIKKNEAINQKKVSITRNISHSTISDNTLNENTIFKICCYYDST